MPEFSGPVQHVELSSTLWLIPLLPLLGCVINAFLGRKLQAATALRGVSRRLHIGSLGVSFVALGAMFASFALAVWHVARLAALPEGARFLLPPLANGADRFGRVQFRLRARSVVVGDDPRHHRHRLADPHLRRRLHGTTNQAIGASSPISTCSSSRCCSWCWATGSW